MAYAYDRTMQALGLTGQPDQQDQGSVTVSQEAVGQGSGAGASSSDGGGQQQQQQMQQPAAAAGARGRVMSRNVQKAKAPTDMGRITSSIGQARQNIQNEANAYVEAADDPYEQSREQIRSNVQNYAQGKPGDLSWLTQYQSAPGLVGDIDLKTDTNIKDVDLLGSDAGIREMFRRSQDPEGTIGEAALDASLLRRNEGFNLARDEALRGYQQLQKEKGQILEESRGKAQEKRAATAKTFKDTVGEELGAYGSSLDKAAAEREAAFDAQLAQLEEYRRQNAFQEAQNYLNEVAGSGQYDPYVADALRQSLGEGSLYTGQEIDPYQFYTPGMTAEQTQREQFYTEDEANQWNRIMGLLGTGGTMRAGGSLATGSAQDLLGGGLDRQALLDAAMKQAAPRAAETQVESQRIQAAADQKAQAKARDEEAKRAEQNKANAARFAEMKKAGIAKEDMTPEDRAAYDSMPPAQREAYDKEIAGGSGRHKRDPYWARKVNKILRGR